MVSNQYFIQYYKSIIYSFLSTVIPLPFISAIVFRESTQRVRWTESGFLYSILFTRDYFGLCIQREILKIYAYFLEKWFSGLTVLKVGGGTQPRIASCWKSWQANVHSDALFRKFCSNFHVTSNYHITKWEPATMPICDNVMLWV